MAELPEVEIARRELSSDVVERRIASVAVPGPNAAIPWANSKAAFADHLVGKKFRSVSRDGMLLLFELDVETPESFLVASLGPTGALRRCPSRTPLEEPATRVVITFAKGGDLRLLDSGVSATLRVVTKVRYHKAYPEQVDLGFDPSDSQIPWTEFGLMLRGRHESIRDLLLDQTFVVGIGPVYSDEILHAARLGHERPASSLNMPEIRRLYRAVVETIHESLKRGGCSANGYLNVNGKAGGFDPYLEVWGKAGQRAPNGRGEVLTKTIDGTTHHYCAYQT